MKWIETQLLPNLPKKSVLVVSNMSYHNVVKEPSITSTSRKEEMINWLQKNHISYLEDLMKPELYYLIKDKIEAIEPKTYKLDELLESHGHTVLRVPPYHPELNPINKIWTLVQNWVERICSLYFKNEDIENIVEAKINSVPVKSWKEVCEDLKKYEVELIDRELVLDELSESFQSDFNNDSIDDCSELSGSDSEMSGIEDCDNE